MRKFVLLAFAALFGLCIHAQAYALLWAVRSDDFVYTAHEVREVINARDEYFDSEVGASAWFVGLHAIDEFGNQSLCGIYLTDGDGKFTGETTDIMWVTEWDDKGQGQAGPMWSELPDDPEKYKYQIVGLTYEDDGFVAVAASDIRSLSDIVTTATSIDPTTGNILLPLRDTTTGAPADIAQYTFWHECLYLDNIPEPCVTGLLVAGLSLLMLRRKFA